MGSQFHLSLLQQTKRLSNGLGGLRQRLRRRRSFCRRVCGIVACRDRKITHNLRLRETAVPLIAHQMPEPPTSPPTVPPPKPPGPEVDPPDVKDPPSPATNPVPVREPPAMPPPVMDTPEAPTLH